MRQIHSLTTHCGYYLLTLSLAWLALPAASAAADTFLPAYSVTRLGLYDAQHTSSSGLQTSAISLSPWDDYSVAKQHQLITASGYAVGTSTIYSGATATGTTPWLYDPTSGSTITLAISGSSSTATDINAAGQVVGTSGKNYSNKTYWRYDPSTQTTTPINLTSVETLNNPAQYAQPGLTFISNTGAIASDLGQWNGRTAFYANPDTNFARRLGFTNDTTTNSYGEQSSKVKGMNSAGIVIGESTAYGAAVAYGSWGWMYNPATDTQIQLGILESGWWPTSFNHNTYVHEINDAGWVRGSTSYSSNSSLWLRNPTTGQTVKVSGLTGDTYQQYSEAPRNDVVEMSAQGHLVGTTLRLPASSYPTTFAGQDAWFFHAGFNGTVQIGLTGVGYQMRSNKFVGDTRVRQESTPIAMNDSGAVVGRSLRATSNPNSTATAGYDVWLFKPSTLTTVRLGLFGGLHGTGAIGSQYESTVKDINNANDVIGATKLSGLDGQTGWFYDDSTGIIHPLSFSTDTLGQTFTEPMFLGEDSTVLGSYRKYAGDSLLGTFAFGWSLDKGFSDLGLLIDGDLNALGWSSLASAFAMDATGQIFGSGAVIGSGQQGLFVLTQPVPEPSTLALLGVGAATGLGLLRQRRAWRKSKA